MIAGCGFDPDPGLKPAQVLHVHVRARERDHLMAAAQRLAHDARADEAVGAGDGADRHVLGY